MTEPKGVAGAGYGAVSAGEQLSRSFLTVNASFASQEVGWEAGNWSDGLTRKEEPARQSFVPG